MSFAIASLVFLLRFPVFFGGGETIAHLRDIPDDQRAGLVVAGMPEPAIGYKYEYFSMFFIDLWTGGGEVVVYDEDEGDRYVEVSDDELRSLVGESAEDLGKPFFYRIPFGWFVVVVGAAVVITRMVRDARRLPG